MANQQPPAHQGQHRSDEAKAAKAVEFSDANYAALAEFRYALRKFLAFSESAAKEVGLTSQQHQALLALKGFAQGGSLSVGDLAETRDSGEAPDGGE